MRICVLRGDNQEQLRTSPLGSWNRASRASMSGSFVRPSEDGRHDLVKQCATTYSGVNTVGAKTVHQILPLKDFAEEDQRDADPTILRQGRVCG